MVIGKWIYYFYFLVIILYKTIAKMEKKYFSQIATH